MYNIFVRANAVFFYWTTVIFFLSMGCSITSFFFEANPAVSLELNKFEELSYVASYNAENALFSLDIDADLTTLFNWNVKQLFVWVSAEYVTRTYKKNQVILWDTIIEDVDEAHLQLKDEKLKYELQSFEKELRNREINLTLSWDIMPVVGVLKMQGGQSSNVHTITLPQKYVKLPMSRR
mmetsp:Transcript_12895/g.23417  ORF Transcript_12895/g.23417 Transcript_12895/m.23417 type:complete len:180 (+) Transcript_12895:208-747(+)|eukprot:CAMPEP_0197515222 /NCGR_PEP_ID=MMETSP1318-20131121/418_1 /TAXON_ID=552666 /ORGANISM="Partenskyella glossopodia, Strain RCC365" /LENGTH=179 /DNA_ID=CAMNT_0043063531 /DNA_START=208 /DNA_END=747 /DNA_ORIENTATION=+